MKLQSFLAFAVLASVSGSLSAATRTVALTGQSAPGAPSGATFAQLFEPGADYLGPSINKLGHTAFAATLTQGVGGITAVNDSGVWSDSSGTLANVALEGSPTLGLPAGVAVQRASEPVINNAGQVAFHGLVAGVGVNANNNEVIWSRSAGSTNVILREGSAVPGAGAGVTFSTLFEPGLGPNGHTVMRAIVKGTGVTGDNDRGFWASAMGGVRQVARTGNPAPGFPDGVVWDALLPASPLINGSGQVAFRMLTSGTGVTTANDGGIWIERLGALSLVAREGSPAPALPATIVFATLGDPSINRQGDVAFTSTLTGAGVGANNFSLWVDRNGTLSMAAREGQTVQGNVKFSTFGHTMLNSRGDVAFIGATTGWGGGSDTQDGIWIKPSDAPWRSIVQSGTTLAALPGGVFNTGFANPVLNGTGQIAFLGTLAGTGVTTANDRALWVEGLDKQLRLVAREGDAMQVAQGVMRTISSLDFVGGVNNEQGARSGLSDLGEVAFLATFTDGSSGVFVSDVASSKSSDFNGDGAIDGSDYLVWQRNFGLTGSGTVSTGDANGDGNVNAADLGAWKSAFGLGASAAAITAVPEPSAAFLSFMALGGFGMRQRTPWRRVRVGRRGD